MKSKKREAAKRSEICFYNKLREIVGKDIVADFEGEFGSIEDYEEGLIEGCDNIIDALLDHVSYCRAYDDFAAAVEEAKDRAGEDADEDDIEDMFYSEEMEDYIAELKDRTSREIDEMAGKIEDTLHVEVYYSEFTYAISEQVESKYDVYFDNWSVSDFIEEAA